MPVIYRRVKTSATAAARWLLTLSLAFATLVGTAPLAAQVQGTVMGSQGEPLEGVAVELRDARARIAVTRTDASGLFSFPSEHSAAARILVLSRVGYRTLSFPVSAAAAAPRYRMESLPVSLPELTVLAVRDACPNRDQGKARQLWHAVRRRYDTTSTRRGVAFWALTAGEVLSPDRVGEVDESRLELASTQSDQSGSGTLLLPPPPYYADVDLSIREHGYAVRVSPERVVHYPDFFHWVYPALGSRHSTHFLSEAFGSLHSLSLVAETDDSYVLAFCPHSHRQPAIEGTLTLARDSTLRSAAWSFHTPKPREEAGGEVVFAPWDAPAGRLPHLLPARSIFWRRQAGRKSFYQRPAVFLCWVVSPDALAPELPTQPPKNCSLRFEVD